VNISLFQQLYNNSFFICHNALIYVLYITDDYRKSVSIYYGAAVIANFALFLLVNIFTIMASGFCRIRRACNCFGSIVHPRDSITATHEQPDRYNQAEDSTYAEYSGKYRFKSTKIHQLVLSKQSLCLSTSSVATSPGLDRHKYEVPTNLSVIVDNEQQPEQDHEQPLTDLRASDSTIQHISSLNIVSLDDVPADNNLHPVNTVNS